MLDLPCLVVSAASFRVFRCETDIVLMINDPCRQRAPAQPQWQKLIGLKVHTPYLCSDRADGEGSAACVLFSWVGWVDASSNQILLHTAAGQPTSPLPCESDCVIAIAVNPLLVAAKPSNFPATLLFTRSSCFCLSPVSAQDKHIPPGFAIMGQPCLRQLPSCANIGTSDSLESGLQGYKTNSAFIFLKPAAVTNATVVLVQSCLQQAGIKTISSGAISAEQISRRGLVDEHYKHVQSKALSMNPKDLAPTKAGLEEFKRTFCLLWRSVVKQGLVLNAAQAADKLRISPIELSRKFALLRRGTEVVRLG
eukprot:2248533-Amphidinium_carterae.1